MLAQMRSKKFIRRVMKWTLILVIPSFVFFYGWGPSGEGQGPGGQLPWYAQVKTRWGGLWWEKIEQVEMQQAEYRLKQVLSNFGGGQNSSRYTNSQSILRNALNERIINNIIDEYGFKTSQAEIIPTYEMLRQALANTMEQPVTNELLETFITSPQELGGLGKYSIPAFEQELAQEMTIRKVQESYSQNIRPNLWEIWDYFRQENQEITLSYSPFSASNYEDKVEFTTDTLRQYYEEFSENYRTEEEATYRYVAIPFSDVSDAIEVTEEESLEYYEDNNNKSDDQFWQEHKVDLSHIALEIPENANTTDTKAIKARLDAIWDELHQDPAPLFADIANKYSEDPANVIGETKMGGRLIMPIMNPTDYPHFGPVFTSAALDPDLKDGNMVKIDDPSDFGYHILKADRVTTAGPQPYFEARIDAEYAVRNQKATIRFGELYQQMSIEWEAVTDLDLLARKMNFDVQETDWVPVGGPTYLPGVGILTEFQEDIKRLKENTANLKPFIPSGGQQYCLVIQLTEKRDPYTPPFEEVFDRVEEDYRQREAAKLAIAASKEFLAGIGDDDQLTSKAAEQGLSHQTTSPFVRSNYQTVMLQTLAGFTRDSLDATTGTVGLSYIGSADNPIGCYVWQVVSTTDPDMNAFNESYYGFATNNQQRFGQVLMNEHLADRRKAIRTKLHPELLPVTDR